MRTRIQAGRSWARAPQGISCQPAGLDQLEEVAVGVDEAGEAALVRVLDLAEQLTPAADDAADEAVEVVGLDAHQHAGLLEEARAPRWRGCAPPSTRSSTPVAGAPRSRPRPRSSVMPELRRRRTPATRRCRTAKIVMPPRSGIRRPRGQRGELELENLARVRRSTGSRASATVNVAAELLRDAGERRAVEPAGAEARERGEVAVDVEREAVAHDPAARADAERGDLALADPDADVLAVLARRRPRCRASASASDERRARGRARSAAGPCRGRAGRGSGSRRAGPARARSSGRRGRSRRPPSRARGRRLAAERQLGLGVATSGRA